MGVPQTVQQHVWEEMATGAARAGSAGNLTAISVPLSAPRDFRTPPTQAYLGTDSCAVNAGRGGVRPSGIALNPFEVEP